jgi:hypothetical protein
MSAINPNNKPILLVDDFIQLAKEHLLTVKGQASCITTYTATLGSPLPGSARWTGYVCQAEEPKLEIEEVKLKRQTTSFKPTNENVVPRGRVITDYDLDAELTGEGVVYDEMTDSFGKKVTNYGRTAQTSFVGTNSQAKAAAEAYLGRAMTDSEWADLVAITFAETTTNQTERAWVMGTILNRTRLGYTPRGIQNKRYSYSTVTDIINQPWQYQPVTGTRFEPGPKSSFLNGPDRANATSIYGAAVNLLKDVPKAYINFTSNNPAAYKRGTNINYLYTLRANPNSKIIGGTIFGF